jgi:hypothetical protein
MRILVPGQKKKTVENKRPEILLGGVVKEALSQILAFELSPE